MYSNSSSRINTKVTNRGDIKTNTVNNPSGLIVDARSGRFGREGTSVTIGFESSTNRNLKLDGHQARALYRALQKHYDEFRFGY